jgi:hypothetical protein
MLSTRRHWRRFVLASSCLFALASATGSAQPVEIAAACPEVLRLTERSNISRRDDGRYVGLINILVTGNLSISDEIRAVDEGFQTIYEGLFLRFEQTRRDMNQVARPVDQSIQTSITWNSMSLFYSLSPYPTLLRIPTLPSGSTAPGTTWEAPGVATINPLN